jgi:hypothetical protein
METALIALAAAALSGFGGAMWGARIANRHDRIERLRARRIDAADEMLQEWALALFAIDAAINELETPAGQIAERVETAVQHVNTAIRLSVRVDLLFTIVGATAANANAVRDEARHAILSIRNSDAKEARRHHGEASLHQAWLVNAAGEAISSTGTKHDDARRFTELRSETDLHPAARISRRHDEQPPAS